MKILVIVLLLVVGQIFGSCDSGGGPTVIGWVEAKLVRGDARLIVVLSVEYDVPEDFFIRVSVGDLVKYENGVWTIVRKVGT